MTPRDHDNLTADLSAYLDGELDPGRRAEVEQLLATSDEARRTLDDVRAVSDGLATLPRLRAPDTLAATMLRHAERRLLLDSGGLGRRWRVLRRVGQIGAAAAVLAACVFVGYEALRQQGAGPARQQEAVPAESRVDSLRADAKSVAPSSGDVLERTEEFTAGIDLARGREGESLEADDEKLLVAARGLGSSRGAPAAASPAEHGAAAPEAASEGTATLAEMQVAELLPAPDQGGPVVRIWVTPQTEQEHRGALTVLAGWIAEPKGVARADATTVESIASHAVVPETEGRFSAGGAGELAGRPAPIEAVFSIAPADLNSRILALGRCAPDQVQVQMNYGLRDQALVAQAAGAPADEGPPLEPEATAPPPAAAYRVTTDNDAAVEAMAQPASRPIVEPTEDDADIRRALIAKLRAMRDGGDQPTRARKGRDQAIPPWPTTVPHTAAPTPPDSQPSARAPLAEGQPNQAAATGEPSMATPALERVPATQPVVKVPATQPMGPASPPPAFISPEALVGRLLQMLLEPLPPPEAPPAPSSQPAAPAGAERLTLRVIVLPPPPATQPAGAAAQPVVP